MELFWGGVLTILALVCWAGQAFSWLEPALAVRLGIMEAEHTVEPSFFADGRGEAMWDTATLWTMVVAGMLLTIDQSGWAYFGLVGGGMYLYFAGRGIATRVAMQHHGLRIGTARNIKIAFAFLTLWGVIAVITIVAAIDSLRSA